MLPKETPLEILPVLVIPEFPKISVEEYLSSIIIDINTLKFKEMYKNNSNEKSISSVTI